MNKNDLCPCPSCGSTNITVISYKASLHGQYKADVCCTECHRFVDGYGDVRKSAEDSAKKCGIRT